MNHEPQREHIPPSRGTGITLAASGVLVLSFDALLIRLAAASEWDVVFWRGWLILLSISIVMVLTRQRLHMPKTGLALLAAGVISVMYGLNSTIFVYALSHTSTANTVVMLASSPLFAALFSWMFLRERIAPRTVIAITMAIAGVTYIFIGAIGAPSWRGDLAAVFLAISMGASLTLLRRFPELPRLPLVALSGAVAGMIALPFSQPLSLAVETYTWLAIMGLLQIPLATWLVMTAPRHLPSAEVSLFLLIETVLGPFWVWLVVGEQVPENTMVGGSIIVAAIAMNSWFALREARSSTLMQPVRRP